MGEVTIVMISGSVHIGADGKRYRRLAGPKNIALVQLCETTARGDGLPCERSRVAGRDHCVVHGGHIPAGVENGRFTHGRYSQFITLPALNERVEALVNDPELTSLRANLALVDARIAQLLERIDGASATPFWIEAGDVCQQYGEALDAGNAAAPMLFLRLRRLLEGGYDEDKIWAEIALQHELRRRLTESEGKTLERLGHSFTVEEATLFIRELAGMMREFVSSELHGAFVQRLRLLQLGMYPGQRKKKINDED